MTQSLDPIQKDLADFEVPMGDVASVGVESQECVAFQSLMPNRIGAGEDLQSDPHLLTCERCRALVRDLEYIAQVARDLMQMEEEPRDELWDRIKLEIARGED